jgi:hypothetical protein
MKNFIKLLTTILLPVAGIIIPLILYFSGVEKKSLSIYIKSRSDIININENENSEIKVLYNNEQVSGLKLLTFDIKNDGSSPIKRTDFDSPIKVNFGDKSKIYKAVVVKTEPIGIEAQIANTESEITLQPLLLNAGDTLSIQAIISNIDEIPEMSSRIFGMPSLSIKDEQASKMTKRKTLLYIFVFLLVIIYANQLSDFIYSFIETGKVKIQNIFISLVSGFGSAFLLVDVSQDKFPSIIVTICYLFVIFATVFGTKWEKFKYSK